MKTAANANKSEFTLIDLMTALIIVGIFASAAVTLYIKYKKEGQIELAITELKIIEKKIANIVLKNGKLPDDLSEIGVGKIVDPWGRPYRYLKIYGSDDVKDGRDNPRINQSQDRINTDFDLYSVGRDGNSAASLTATISRDDIIRAKNGGAWDWYPTIEIFTLTVPVDFRNGNNPEQLFISSNPAKKFEDTLNITGANEDEVRSES
ncbi:MAG: hypothetical protein PVG41_19350 [Desulfobacteraceae bacterium]